MRATGRVVCALAGNVRHQAKGQHYDRSGDQKRRHITALPVTPVARNRPSEPNGQQLGKSDARYNYGFMEAAPPWAPFPDQKCSPAQG
jgi:hypothetical protein